MTSIKVALSALGAVAGASTALTGAIIANIPAISDATPVTLGLVTAGLGASVVMAWKVSRAWAQLENRLAQIETRLAHFERVEEKRNAGV